MVPFQCQYIWLFYILAERGDKAQKRGKLMIHIYLVYERLREKCFEKERHGKQI